MSGIAQVLPLTLADGTDVGSVDNLIAQAALPNSGDATELAWVNTVLPGDGYSLLFKNEPGTWYSVLDGDPMDPDPSVFASGISGDTDYFLIKTGSNTGNSNDHFLFQNLSSLNWAVISLQGMGFDTDNILNIGKVSHNAGYGIEPIPEPATMLLMGVGLAGLAATQRRQARKI